MAKVKIKPDPILSRRIRDLRKKRKITQEKLAEEIHVSDQTIRKYESGKFGVPYNSIIAIAQVLACPADYLLDVTDCDSVEEYEKEQAEIDEFMAFANPILKAFMEQREQNLKQRKGLVECVDGYKLTRSFLLEPTAPNSQNCHDVEIYTIQTPENSTYRFRSVAEYDLFFDELIDDVRKLLRYHLFEYEARINEEKRLEAKDDNS